MACEPTTETGKGVKFEYQIACLDVAPVDADWNTFGALRSKNVSNAGNSVDTTADDTEGMYGESIVTGYTKEFSIDGVIRKTGGSAESFADIYAHWNDPSRTGGQPNLWVRFTDDTGVETCPVVITAIDKSSPYDDVSTYSMTLTVTGSPIGVTFVPRSFSTTPPAPPTPAPGNAPTQPDGKKG